MRLQVDEYFFFPIVNQIQVGLTFAKYLLAPNTG